MIDFHSHILPQIDDGSKSLEQSLEMLTMLASQGVDTVALTPHFYGTRRTPEEFLARRNAAYERLRPELTDEMPRVLLGAEVLYFRGITHIEQLGDLCLQGTRTLLLEMPFTTWGEGEIREVIDLCQSGEFTVLLAHIERYMKFQDNEVWDRLLEAGAFMQSNAEFFLPFLSQRKAARMVQEGRIHVLGTDCHNTTSRAPNMAAAVKVLEKRLGHRAMARFAAQSYDLLEEWSLR